MLLFESLAVAGAAVVLGLVLARLAIGPVVRMLPVMLANFGNPSIDLRVIGYSSAIALAAALLTVAGPAWQARRRAPQASLRDGVTVAGGRQRLRRILVAAELTLAVVLLVGASLLVASYARIQRIDPGFRVDHLLTMRLTLAWERFGEPGAVQVFFREFVERLEALPEVERAAATSQFPPQLSFSIQFRVDGVPQDTTTLPTAPITTVTPGYLDVLGVPLRHGRWLGAGDRAGAPMAVVVNEAFVDRYLGGQPNGRLLIGDRAAPAEIVGVVANTRNNTLLRPPQPEIFASIDQAPGNNQLFLLVRTTTDPLGALPAVRRALGEMDPGQPLYLIQTMETALAGSISSQRIGLSLVGGFAAVALLIACIGVYGVVSYWVAMRSREIGIRVALGASASQVTRLVAGETARLVAIGSGLGLAGGILAGRAAGAQLYETSPTDPVALAAVAAILAVVAVAAAYLPARRALGIDPVSALRSD
jgi:predicted permease